LRTRPAAGVGAAAHPAYREVGWRSKEDNVAYINACRLERRPEIQDRIGYLTRQEERLIAEKRQRIEQRLWAIHEANIQDLFEIYEQPKTTKDDEIETDQNGQMRVERKVIDYAVSGYLKAASNWSSAQSISSRVMTSGGLTRMVWS
jgi:hypothetical protein